MPSAQDSDSSSATSGNRRDYRPVGAEQRTGFLPTAKRVFKEFKEDNITDWAAALTYYGLLSAFPALIALVSLVGLFGDPAHTTKTLTEIISKIAPGSAAHTLAGPIKAITSNRSGAGLAFVLGLARLLQ